MATITVPQELTLSDEQRAQMLNEHPIIVKDYTVLTPMISKTYSLVRERVWTRRTGAFLYSRPRMGKTRCAAVLQRLLSIEFPNIHVTRLSADQRRTSSDTGLVSDLLDAEGLAVKKRQTYKEMLSHLLVHISTAVSARAGKQFVLLIDEMQMLSEADLRLLLVLHNRLEISGIAMTTIGFAQPEILETRSALLATKSFNLIARFLSEPIPFDGCAGREDLATILVAYDDEKRFPEDSTWTYTRFFLPEAYQSGFRLKDYAPIIWPALIEASKSLGTGTVPMEHLTRTVEYLLLANRKEDATTFRFDDEMVSTAVAASNLAEFCGLMSQ
jgi:hypothetical protein